MEYLADILRTIICELLSFETQFDKSCVLEGSRLNMSIQHIRFDLFNLIRVHVACSNIWNAPFIH